MTQNADRAVFDAAFETAIGGGEPQLITKHGKVSVVLMRHDDWEWLKWQVAPNDRDEAAP